MATWNAIYGNSPADLDTPTLGDDEIRSLRAAIEERAKNEHTTYSGDSTLGAAVADWLHKAGSAVVFFAATASAPTVRLNGEALVDGMLWYDTTVEHMMIYSGGIWVDLATNIPTTDGRTILTKLIDIGDWNMDSTETIDIAHGLTSTKIINVIGMVRSDDDSVRYGIDPGFSTGSRVYVSETNAINVRLARAVGGGTDNAGYDATSYNRGWLIIQYLP